MRAGGGWLISGAVLVVGVLCALTGCMKPPEQAERLPADSAASETRVRRRSEALERPRREQSVEALLDGSLRPEDCTDEFLAAAAQSLMEIDYGTPDEDCILRLDLIRRMGPAACGVVEQLIECGGGLDDEVGLAGLAALEAIDPDQTLRIPYFLAQRGSTGREIDAEKGLYRIGPSIVPTLIDVLEGRTEGNESTCVDALEHLGPGAAEALPVLHAMAARGDGDAARAVFYISGRCEFGARVLVGELLHSWEFRADVALARPGLGRELTELLGAEDAGSVRRQAALVLVRIAPETEGLAVALAEELGAGGERSSDECRDALLRLGPLAAPALPILTAKQATLGWPSYAKLLAASQDHDRALPALRAAFDDEENAATRPALARALVAFGGVDAERVLPILISQMTEEHVVYPGRRRSRHGTRGPRTVVGRTWAAESLGALGPSAAPAIPALIRALDERSDAVDASVEALVRIGPLAAPSLIRVLEPTNSVALRTGAARALGRMDQPGADELDALRRALRDPALTVRGSAAAGLLRLPSASPAAVPVLREALESAEHSLHREWLAALGADSGAALPAVNAALGHEDLRVRVHAGRAVHTITGDTRPFVAAIRTAILADDGGAYGYDAMKELGPTARDAVPAVARGMRDSDSCPSYVAEALMAVGPDARDAATALAHVVETGLDYDVKRACEVLEAMGPAAEDAVPGLLRKLERSCSWPQASIVRALGAIGPAAEPAVPAIRLRLDDYWRSTRRDARAALDKIESR